MNSFLIRPAQQCDTTQIANIHVISWQQTYQGLLPAACLQQATVAKRLQQWNHYWQTCTSKQFLWVAENATGEIVGFMCGGPERTHHPRFNGELYAIYVLQAWQRTGVGRQLWQQCLSLLREQGATSLLVWVLQHNPARSFYAALGGQLVLGRAVEIAGHTVTEMGYGWQFSQPGTMA